MIGLTDAVDGSEVMNLILDYGSKAWGLQQLLQCLATYRRSLAAGVNSSTCCIIIRQSLRRPAKEPNIMNRQSLLIRGQN